MSIAIKLKLKYEVEICLINNNKHINKGVDTINQREIKINRLID